MNEEMLKRELECDRHNIQEAVDLGYSKKVATYCRKLVALIKLQERAFRRGGS